MATDEPTPTDFIRRVIEADLAAGKHGGRVVTRFPPEPNGYLHLGNAKAISINFGIAAQYGGVCHLRFDDTNPTKEEVEYVEGQQEDIHWLGYDWGEHLYFASDYFERLYEHARGLIRAGKAYVCDLSAEQMREYRGSLTEPGRPSPWRDRPADESLDLFARMRAGEFSDGARVLRAKIDMAAGNVVMRDPVLYRIQHATHHRTGDAWCIYPLYDFTHCISDSIEGITHSLCSLEFEERRPLYDWVLDEIGAECHPQQIEFARLNVSYTATGKRILRQLVERELVRGWDDPRMPTIRGMRRRGFTPEALRAFLDSTGIGKRSVTISIGQLEHFVRDDLNRRTPRVMAVLNPLRVVIENYPEGQTEELECVNNPEDPDAGTRRVPFSRELWIERDDFLEDPPRKFFRLAPGREVRLRYAYFVTCTEVIKDDAGEVVELRCRYDPHTRGGDAPDGRKVKATLHWLSAPHALEAEVRLYDRLFRLETADPDDLDGSLHPDSLEILPRAWVEPSLAGADPESRYQFERLGYFCVDADTQPDRLVFNRTVTLRDTWARVEAKGGA